MKKISSYFALIALATFFIVTTGWYAVILLETLWKSREDIFILILEIFAAIGVYFVYKAYKEQKLKKEKIVKRKIPLSERNLPPGTITRIIRMATITAIKKRQRFEQERKKKN